MTLLLCILIFVLAGLTKGVLGLGLPTVAMSLLALLMTPAEAAALLLIPRCSPTSGSSAPVPRPGRRSSACCRCNWPWCRAPCSAYRC